MILRIWVGVTKQEREEKEVKCGMAPTLPFFLKKEPIVAMGVLFIRLQPPSAPKCFFLLSSRWPLCFIHRWRFHWDPTSSFTSSSTLHSHSVSSSSLVAPIFFKISSTQLFFTLYSNSSFHSSNHLNLSPQPASYFLLLFSPDHTSPLSFSLSLPASFLPTPPFLCLLSSPSLSTTHTSYLP